MKKSYLFYSFLVIITMTFFNCKKDENKASNDFSGEEGSFIDSRDNNKVRFAEIFENFKRNYKFNNTLFPAITIED